jgi:membrane dipeptidase
MLLSPHRLWADDVDPSVAQIVASTIAVDMHNHIETPYVRNPANAKPDPALDLKGEMKRSGLSAICQVYAVDDLYSTEVGEPHTYELACLAFEDKQLAQNGIRRALNMKDLQTAHDQGQPIVIQAAEGAQFIEGRLERVEEAYKRGLRIMGPIHNVYDLVSPLGDTYTAKPRWDGMTPFGAEVIKECNRLGIVVDLTHGTYDVVKQALMVSTQPMLYTHTSLPKVAPGRTISADLQRRSMSTEEAKMIAQAGGVIGIWWRAANSLKGYVEAIRDMVDATDADHVGLGTDTNISDPNGSMILPYTNGIWMDQQSGFFYAVAGEMLKQGFTPDEIRKIGGGNFCRVFADVTDKHV